MCYQYHYYIRRLLPRDVHHGLQDMLLRFKVVVVVAVAVLTVEILNVTQLRRHCASGHMA